MASYIERARSALRDLLGGHPQPAAAPAPSPEMRHQERGRPVGKNIEVLNGTLAFVDPSGVATHPTSWLDIFGAAIAEGLPASESATAILASHVARWSPTELLPPADVLRFRDLLRPRAGLTIAMKGIHQVGVLGTLFPKGPFSTKLARDGAARPGALDAAALRTTETYERLLGDTSLMGERFGSMLRELRAPELLMLVLLLRQVVQPGDTQASDTDVDAQIDLDRLQIQGDDRRAVEFLLRHRLDMSLLGFRQDTGDASVVRDFAGKFSTEEHLKMLCLVTIGDLAGTAPAALTPWKAELLWRLFVDTYNHMTMTYGDELIDTAEAALGALQANRPHDITEGEVSGFLEGLPRRYLTLFEAEAIYQHVRLWHNIGQDDVHFLLSRRADIWELTVLTLDKPYLFSNICGVLSYLDLDILRGHAFTARGALVLDVFQFTDHKGCLVRPQLDPLLSDVVAGRANITALLREKERPPAGPARHGGPVIYFDNDSSQRFTILELVADDAPGLLHQISRIISKHGCVVDLVLISTEARRAIDVFHLRKLDGKLTDSDEIALTEDLERMLEGEPPHARPAPVG